MGMLAFHLHTWSGEPIGRRSCQIGAAVASKFGAPEGAANRGAIRGDGAESICTVSGCRRDHARRRWLPAIGAKLGPAASQGVFHFGETAHRPEIGCRPQGSAVPRVHLFGAWTRSEEHTSELQSPVHLVCRLLLE